MNAKLKAALKSFAKYIGWTLAAAMVQWVAANYTSWHMPDVYVPIVGAVLKSAASWVATKGEI